MRQRVIKKLKQIGSDGSVSHSSFILNSDSEVSFYDNGKWRFFRFNGQTKWVEQTGSTENNQELLKYMLNAYRVLLTRARAGMVICVPYGNGKKTVSGFREDSTRLPEYRDVSVFEELGN